MIWLKCFSRHLLDSSHPWARHFTPRKYWLITQEAMAPSRHDWKIVNWDVKPQHNQPTKIRRKGNTIHGHRRPFAKYTISLTIKAVWNHSILFENKHLLFLSRSMTKAAKWLERPAKTQTSLGIRSVWWVFTVRSMGSYGPNVSSYGQQRLWSDWADALVYPRLRWAHRLFCWICRAVAHIIIICFSDDSDD